MGSSLLTLCLSLKKSLVEKVVVILLSIYLVGLRCVGDKASDDLCILRHLLAGKVEMILSSLAPYWCPSGLCSVTRASY